MGIRLTKEQANDDKKKDLWIVNSSSSAQLLWDLTVREVHFVSTICSLEQNKNVKLANILHFKAE